MRPDLEVVAGLIQPGSRVLDLGCGDGLLLATLSSRMGCSGTGIENDPSALVAAIRRGVSVMGLDIDVVGPAGLDEFDDASYDVVIVSQTLQATRNPARILDQVKRIAGRGVVSVPNFGLWKHRAALGLRGRMPVSSELPHPWFETPNIHLSTLADMEELIADRGLGVEQRILLDSSGRAAIGLRSRGPPTP